MVLTEIFFPFHRPASMGPPLTTTAGMFRRPAAMSMPGTILSQFGMSTSPSKAWALAMASMESQISSRLARGYFIPMWPMAIPSQMAMAGNSTGVPPAAATPSFTASAISRRCIWPGTISLNEFTMPIIGFARSSLEYPMAWNNVRCAERVAPFFTMSLLICFPLSSSLPLKLLSPGME